MDEAELATRFSVATTIEVEHVMPLEGGVFNISALVSTSLGSIVLRSPRYLGDWNASPLGQRAAMELVRAAGLPVPEVIYADEDILAYLYVPGEAMTAAHAASGLAEQAGELFGRMHAIAAEGVGPVQPDGSSPDWPSSSYFGTAPDEIDRLLNTFDEAWGIRRADLELAAGLLSTPPILSGALVQGDAGPGNLVVADAAITSIIDFDNASYSDASIDVASWWWRAPNTADAFQRGCESAGDRFDPVTLWACRVRLLVSLADVFVRRMPESWIPLEAGRLLAVAVPQLELVS